MALGLAQKKLKMWPEENYDQERDDSDGWGYRLIIPNIMIIWIMDQQSRVLEMVFECMSQAPVDLEAHVCYSYQQWYVVIGTVREDKIMEKHRQDLRIEFA